MRISEVIAQLSSLEARHGDLEVDVETHHGGGAVVDVYAWDTDIDGTVAVVTTVP